MLSALQLGWVPVTEATQADLEADARERWWETIRWVWDNRYELPDDALVDALAAMEERTETAEQSIFLDVTTSAILER